MASNIPYPNKKIIRVVPTLSTDAYAQQDVLFTSVEIPNAVFANGGCSTLSNMFVVDRSDQSDVDIQFFFTEKNTALGTQNATADISAANMKSIGVCGFAELDGNLDTSGNSIDNVKIHRIIGTNINDDNAAIPLTLLQAESDTTSVYVHAIIKNSVTPTYAADSLDLIFHIEY